MFIIVESTVERELGCGRFCVFIFSIFSFRFIFHIGFFFWLLAIGSSSFCWYLTTWMTAFFSRIQ